MSTSDDIDHEEMVNEETKSEGEAMVEDELVILVNQVADMVASEAEDKPEAGGQVPEEEGEEKLVSLTSMTSSKQSEDDECKTDRDYDENSFDKFKRGHVDDHEDKKAQITASSSTETLSPSVSIAKADETQEEDDSKNQVDAPNIDSLASASALTQKFNELLTINRSSPIEQEKMPGGVDDDVLSPKASPRRSQPVEPVRSSPPTPAKHESAENELNSSASSAVLRANILECEIKLDYEDMKLHDVSTDE